MTAKGHLTRAAIAAALALEGVHSTVPAAEPSPAYRAGLKRTAALRKQRRRDATAQSVGVIEPYPFPPALIIRHTPQVHDEVRGLLDVLRR
jgi:hypothetical protein